MKNITLLDLNGYFWTLWALYWTISARFVQKTKSSESILLRLQHLLPTVLGFVLIFGPHWLGISPHRVMESPALEIVGDLLTAAGLLFAIWARIHLGRYWSGIITLKEGHKLIRTGPYLLARHPIYTGFLGAMLGSVLAVQTAESIFAFLLVGTAFLIKLRREEAVLTQQFGDEYRRFKNDVKTLVPFIY